MQRAAPGGRRSNHFVAASALFTCTTPLPVASVPQQRWIVGNPGPCEMIGQFGAMAAGRDNADFSRIDSACAAVSDGFFSAISATVPVTCGVAIEVPPKY